MKSPRWVCCQLGAREHYSVPRALRHTGRLERLFTDAWVDPSSTIGQLPLPIRSQKLRQRYHADLKNAPVTAFNAELFRLEITMWLGRRSRWKQVIERNHWFERVVVQQLDRLFGKDRTERFVFAYSYAARDILRYAKNRGWRTVLGQIDAGPVHEEIGSVERAREPTLSRNEELVPPGYWERWSEEVALADKVIVNSEWSMRSLSQVGVGKEKLCLIPLAFEAIQEAIPPPKNYPSRFTAKRPLRVLFLGRICLTKGIGRLLRAADALRDEPVEFWMVGPYQIDRTGTPVGARKVIKWIGPVSRANTKCYLRDADVFILPTLSDGFALTQLEALSNRLPVIASRNCGKVVRHEINGLLLEEPSAEHIEASIRHCLSYPARLASYSEGAALTGEFRLESVARKLISTEGNADDVLNVNDVLLR